MLEKEIKDLLLKNGVSDVGFCSLKDTDAPLPFAVSIAVRISDAVIDEIDGAPTATYFSHYRTVNAFIDRCILEAGLFLQKNGYKYIPVAASQSMPGTPFFGRFQHKTAARLSGMGTIGKNALFLHSEYGARVRLGTLLTDCPVERDREMPESVCFGCDACKNACPSGAILGKEWHEGITTEEMFSPAVCSEYMKAAFKHIGRGAVCGICIKVCPALKKEKV